MAPDPTIPEPFVSTAALKSLSPSTKLAIDTVRTLSMDAVQAAESGHPGTPMALAPLAYVLFYAAYAP